MQNKNLAFAPTPIVKKLRNFIWRRRLLSTPVYSNIRKMKLVRGFTLIELIIIMLLILFLVAIPMPVLLAFFMQNIIFLPNQMNAQQAAGAAIEIIIEGDDNAKGLRFETRITAADGNSISFTNSEGNNIRYRINIDNENRLERSINGASWEIIPYYATGNLTVTCQDGGLFDYFDENGTLMLKPVSLENLPRINRIRINLQARTGTGNITFWEGQITLGSSIKIHSCLQN